MRWFLVLLVTAGVLALVGTLTQIAVAGWLGIAALLGAVVAYVQWRREVRRTRYSVEDD
jgi:membrane protein DedA with SNARE-associated domain